MHMTGSLFTDCISRLGKIFSNPSSFSVLTKPGPSEIPHPAFKTLNFEGPLENTFQSSFGATRSIHHFNATASSKISIFFDLDPIQFFFGRGCFQSHEVDKRQQELARLTREWLVGGPKIHGLLMDPSGNSTIVVEARSAPTGTMAIVDPMADGRSILLAYDEVAEYAWRQYEWILPRSTPDHWLLEPWNPNIRYIPKSNLILVPVNTNPMTLAESQQPAEFVLEALRRRYELLQKFPERRSWPEFYHEIAAAGYAVSPARDQYLKSLQEISPQLSERLTEKK